nr:hypothetical protein [Tanacetum cinerariifolium]
MEKREKSKSTKVKDGAETEEMLNGPTRTHLMGRNCYVHPSSYVEAIVVPPILAEHFKLKHSLINMMTSDQFFRLEKDNPHDHIRWFNKITSTIKYKDVPNSEIKLMLFSSLSQGQPVVALKKNPRIPFSPGKILFPNSSMNSFLPQERQISEMKFPTFNNGLMNRFMRHGIVTKISFVHALIMIAKRTHAVNQQTSVVTTVMTAILKQFQAKPPPASVKAVEEICVTCGGAHPYYPCLTADGNTFSEFQDNIQGYISAAAVNYNQVNSGYRPPSVANQIRPLGFAQPNV